MLLSAQVHASNDAQPGAPLTILLLESQGQDFPFVESLHDSFRETVLQSQPRAQIYTEFLEAVRLGQGDRPQALANFLSSYSNVGLDAIVYRGPEAYEFGLKFPELLPGVPRYASTDKPIDIEPDNTVTFSPYIFSPQESLSEIVRLINPQQIFFLGSETAGTSAHALETFRAAAAELQSSIKLIPMFASNLQQMRSLVAEAPAESAFILSPFIFADDRSLTPRAITQELAESANAPLFVTHSTLMGTGAIGGSLFSAANSGKALAETVLGVQHTGSSQTLMYDGEVAARWNLSPDRLLPDTELVTPFPAPKTISKVIILGDLDKSRKRTQAIIDGFVAEHKESNSSVDYVVINSAPVNLQKNPDSPALKAQIESIIGFDAVVASWAEEARFIERNFEEKWLITFSPSSGIVRPYVVEIGRDFGERTYRTAQLALTLAKRNGSAFVVLGDFSDDTTTASIVEAQLKRAGFAQVSFFYDRDTAALEEQVSKLDSSDTLFYLPLSHDQKDNSLTPFEVSQKLGLRSAAPMLSMWQNFIGRGAVAGYAFRPELAGRAASRAIEDINADGRAEDLYSASSLIVDHQAFAAFGGDVDQLPAGAEIINPPQNLDFQRWWSENRVSVTVTLLVLLSILGLYLRERSQRVRFNRLNDQLSQSAETQKEMFAVVGHELRTPVATIAMVIDDEDQSDAEKLNTVGDISRNLLSVLEDLRTVVDPNRAKEVQFTTSRPTQVIQRALTPLSQITRDKGMTVNFQADAELDQLYYYREQALRQLVTNLVKNAAVHSGGRQIWVRLESISEVERESLMRLQVADDGKGIGENQIDRLFTPFARGTNNKDGAGLGLYIGTELARALGGELKYDRRPEGGSIFTLEFALQKVNAEQSEPEKPSTNLQGLRILFAEDDLTLRMLTEKSLGKQGAKVDSFTNGKLALDAFDSSKYDLVLTDLMMPEMDGQALIRALRARSETVRIIVVTAAVVGKETEQLMQDGATGIISKPISPAKLIELL